MISTHKDSNAGSGRFVDEWRTADKRSVGNEPELDEQAFTVT
jgi:hypothetical protein